VDITVPIFLFLALLVYACGLLARQQRRIRFLEARQRKREAYLYAEIIRHEDAGIYLAEQNVALPVMYAKAAAARETWKSHALACEVLGECIAEDDWIGAQNAAKAAASSRQTLQAMGEYDA
jgi:hypothetical protein